MKSFQTATLFVSVLALTCGASPLLQTAAADPVGGGVDQQIKDFTNFREFFFAGTGPCIPITLNSISRLQLTASPSGDYVLRLWILEKGLLGADLCLQDIYLSGVNCVKETPLPQRLLTQAEVLATTSVFSHVIVDRSFEPSCDVRGHRCSYRGFTWDSFLTHDLSCFDNHLDEDALMRVLALLTRLRRGSEDCNGNDQPDAVDIANASSLDVDKDGMPDECALSSQFRRGDSNGSGEVDISDVIYLFAFLFVGAPAPSCARGGDSDASGVLDVSDGIYLLDYLFLGGPQPPKPYLQCGSDLSMSGLSCDSYAPCRS